MKKEILVFAIPTILFFNSCIENQKTNNQYISEKALVQIDSKTEIGKWEKELLDSKKIGAPCDYKNMASPEAEKWAKENPNQNNGWPSDDKDIQTVKADFDADNHEDLLMYFVSHNCTGHNGGNPYFAKLVFANGTSNSKLMNDIKTAILNQYNEKRASDINLKAVTDSYMDETTTIGYNNGIRGEFRLYTKDDAHCCPSYNGKYKYNLKNKKASIVLNLK